MNAKTERQIAMMKEQTIGVEVEMNHITREDAARLTAEFFGTGRCKCTHRVNGYYTWSAWDDQGREWKFQRDVSISGPDSEKCELVTPILNYDDIETLQELIRRLRRAGAISQAGMVASNIMGGDMAKMLSPQSIAVAAAAVVGREGVREVIELKLNDEEKSLFKKSADVLRKTRI